MIFFRKEESPEENYCTAFGIPVGWIEHFPEGCEPGAEVPLRPFIQLSTDETPIVIKSKSSNLIWWKKVFTTVVNDALWVVVTLYRRRDFLCESPVSLLSITFYNTFYTLYSRGYISLLQTRILGSSSTVV